MLAQKFLMVMRAIVAAAVRMVNAASGRTSQGDDHVQGLDGKIAIDWRFLMATRQQKCVRANSRWTSNHKCH